LSGWLYSTYLNNVYFQTYVDSFSPVLVPVLSVAFGISAASMATYLYLGMKRIQTLREPEAHVKKRAQSRRIPKRLIPASASQPKAANLLQTVPAKLKPIAPPQAHVQNQKPPLKERHDNTSNP
jgi:hypothetical protein